MDEGKIGSLDSREKVSEQRIRWKIVFKVWLISATLFFILSGGFPWTSSGIMDAVMGRKVPFPFLEKLLLHYSIAFFYTAFLAWVVYRFKPLPGIILGFIAGITVLYGINFLLFRVWLKIDPSTEPDAFLTHLVFSSITSALYKGMAIPRVQTRKTPPGRLKHA
jgi:hypothetical protein